MSGERRWGGRGAQRLRAAVLDEYGDICHLCGRPGADSTDHLVPRSHGGSNSMDNLRPAHLDCNRRRGNRPAPGLGAHVTVVTGPPGAGKSTYVAEHAADTDVVIDLDRLAEALRPAGRDFDAWDYPAHVRHVAIGARTEAIKRASNLHEQVGVWFLHSLPTVEQLDSYRARGWSVVTVDPGREVVLARAESRPAASYAAARAYYDGERAPAPPSTLPPAAAAHRARRTQAATAATGRWSW